MTLSNLTIHERAEEFVKKHHADTYEKGQAQIYWRDFFDIFGVDVHQVVVFEESVKKFDGSPGFIDAFWKGKLIIEHKSLGKNLDLAYSQAIEYLQKLPPEEIPDYVIVSDFQRIRLTNLITKEETEIHIHELPSRIHLFDFIHMENTEESPQLNLNLQASRLLADLHEEILNDNYDEHSLELFMVRILFCLYAEDTNIFKPKQFKKLIEKPNEAFRVGEDIQLLFRVLDQKEEDRQSNLPPEFQEFPYVNGALFREPIVPPMFTDSTVEKLLKACEFDWSEINPSIFGSLFQNVVDPEVRRYLGAHYTSEDNINKVINTLFLNDLWDEFYKAKNNKNKLRLLHEKIGNLKFLDPACGCGNFLIITYRQLRELEYKILKILLDEDDSQLHFNASDLTKVKIDHFYGIEIEDFPARVAQVAMWFTQHQMDIKFESLQIHKDNLPLKDSPNIYIKNALELDWKEILPPNDNVYILGNPPFVGSRLQSDEQKEDMKRVFKGFKKVGNLDYVCAWYKKATEYIQNTNIEVCFVSTNSICQGEQSSILWEQLNQHYNVTLNFAHTTFKWSNESKDKAAVYVIIIGFSTHDRPVKKLFKYPKITSPRYEEYNVKHINNYLMDYEDVYVKTRRTPLENVPHMMFGNMPNDGGNLLLTPEEKEELIRKEPQAEKYIHPFISAREFLNNGERYCIWLENYNPAELQRCPLILERVEKVRDLRNKSKRKETQELAKTPTRFGEVRQPDSNYILVPRVSSVNREYIPMAFFDKDKIVSDSCSCVPNAELYDFGILTSKMHMTWVKYICGKLKGDYRYSPSIVYNNYPFPTEVPDDLREAISKCAEDIIHIREKYDSSLAQLYNPLLMPFDLRKAHDRLDILVDKAYRKEKFTDDDDRMKLLFDLYQELI
ncbi:MAG: class I SAM-dependent DNA methyltransferase [Methanobrevibacter sp.]|nr:class I SAM-dependent DNA methyltransferase [Methanobrevibacter sp.]